MPDTRLPGRTPDDTPQIRAVLLDRDHLVRAVWSGRRDEPRRVDVRVVQLQRGMRYQVNTYLDRQSVTRNLTREQFSRELDGLLAMGWRDLNITTLSRTIAVRFSKRGATIVHATAQPRAPERSHDRVKHRVLDERAPFLQVLGVATESGIRAGKRDKYVQIDKFLRLLDESGGITRRRRPLRVVDLGCGNAHLTFAVYHHLRHTLGIEAVVTGVDTKPEAVERNNGLTRRLGWTHIRFVAGRILDHTPATAPDVVLALHACDTATDEALAKAVWWRSRTVLAAPCCHHHLQRQLSRAAAPDGWEPVARHRILTQRLGDMLTDAMRASILSLHGYRTDVFQFVATEHTAKNVMIRATRTGASPPPDERSRYLALCAQWGVIPRLQELLGIPQPKSASRADSDAPSYPVGSA